MKDPNCVFCKIVDGKLPAYKIYENDDFLAFLSIDPTSPGHTLIIPKEHFRWVWDVPTEKIGDYFSVAQKIALAQKQAFKTDLIFSKIIGEEVPHAHIWVFPDSTVRGDKKDFVKNADKIIKNL